MKKCGLFEFGASVLYVDEVYTYYPAFIIDYIKGPLYNQYVVVYRNSDEKPFVQKVGDDSIYIRSDNLKPLPPGYPCLYIDRDVNLLKYVEVESSVRGGVLEYKLKIMEKDTYPAYFWAKATELYSSIISPRINEVIIG